MQEFLPIFIFIGVLSIIVFVRFVYKRTKNSCGKKQCPAVKHVPPGYIKGRKF